MKVCMFTISFLTPHTPALFHLRYVCRAGHKLEAGLAAFGIDPSGLTCLDSGVSTGGFTDCLLQQGAAHVSVCTRTVLFCRIIFDFM